MKVNIIFFLLIFSICTSAQEKNNCGIKIGGGTFTNMKHIIVFHGVDVCNIKLRNDSIKVNMRFYKQTGKLLAAVINSKLNETNNKDLELNYSNSDFSMKNMIFRGAVMSNGYAAIIIN